MVCPYIKLYCKECVEWKAKTKEDALTEATLFMEDVIKHKIQLFDWTWEKTDRKLKPYNVKVEYYSFPTIKQIADDMEDDW